MVRLVPLVLLGGAFLLDLAGRAAHVQPLWIAGHHLGLAGVVAGVLAVAAGMAGHGRQPWGRAALRLAAVGLFALAWWVGGAPEVPPDPLLVGIEGLGAALMAAAARRGRRPTSPLPAR